MNKREIKEECYLDMLEDELNSVDAVLNHIEKVEIKEGIFDEHVIQKDLIRAYFDLELALGKFMHFYLEKCLKTCLFILMRTYVGILIVLFILINLNIMIMIEFMYIHKKVKNL